MRCLCFQPELQPSTVSLPFLNPRPAPPQSGPLFSAQRVWTHGRFREPVHPLIGLQERAQSCGWHNYPGHMKGRLSIAKRNEFTPCLSTDNQGYFIEAGRQLIGFDFED